MSLVSGWGVSMRRARSAFAATGLAAGLLTVGGCVHTGPPTPRATAAGNSGATTASGKDIATASDQTEADRRAKVRLELAYAYFGRGQATDALDEVKQALVSKPDSAPAYALRGLIYAALGQIATADDSFHQARKLAPHDPDVMHNYGWFLCQQKRYADADVEFTSALAEPSYAEGARTTLVKGVCQARAGDMAAAERTLSHAYELDPANPVTAVNLAEVLYRRGEYDRARFYVRRVNVKDELVTAQSLWLAARIERKLGQEDQVEEMGAQLQKRFAQAPETLLFEKGKFDE